jgi:hypothetical protein
MSRLSVFDRLVLVGTVAGAMGCALVWLPLALLFLAVVAFVLAAAVDRRTPPVVIHKPEVAP